MHDDDCQLEFCFSFEKCDEFGASEFCFKKVSEKIGFLLLLPNQPLKNAGLPLPLRGESRAKSRTHLAAERSVESTRRLLTQTEELKKFH
jgi:hypothetical protein